MQKCNDGKMQNGYTKKQKEQSETKNAQK